MSDILSEIIRECARFGVREGSQHLPLREPNASAPQTVAHAYCLDCTWSATVSRDVVLVRGLARSHVDTAGGETDHEVHVEVHTQTSEIVANAPPIRAYQTGDVVRVIEGAFAGRTATVFALGDERLTLRAVVCEADTYGVRRQHNSVFSVPASAVRKERP